MRGDDRSVHEIAEEYVAAKEDFDAADMAVTHAEERAKAEVGYDASLVRCREAEEAVNGRLGQHGVVSVALRDGRILLVTPYDLKILDPLRELQD